MSEARAKPITVLIPDENGALRQAEVAIPPGVWNNSVAEFQTDTDEKGTQTDYAWVYTSLPQMPVFVMTAGEYHRRVWVDPL